MCHSPDVILDFVSVCVSLCFSVSLLVLGFLKNSYEEMYQQQLMLSNAIQFFDFLFSICYTVFIVADPVIKHLPEPVPEPLPEPVPEPVLYCKMLQEPLLQEPLLQEPLLVNF